MSFDVACWVVTAAWVSAAATLAVSARTRARAPMPAVIGAVVATAVVAQVSGAHTLAALGAALLPMAGAIFVLGAPDGELTRWGWRIVVVVACGCAVPLELGAVGSSGYRLSLGVMACGAAAIVAPVAHAQYRTSRGAGRQRRQWIGIGLVLVCLVAVVSVGLRTVVGWPGHLASTLVAATAILPVALVTSSQPGLIVGIDRLLAATVSAIGLTAAVGGAYLLAVLGLGGAPSADGRGVLAVSLAAGTVAALSYRPIRRRLAERANRIVYGEVVAPDAALRTFGTRLTRAVPMDELLLQLAESLRRSLGSRRTEIWTGMAGVYQLAASSPRRGASALTLGPEELPVVARAGVTGGGWAKVWLNQLAADQDPARLRIAPLTDRGELLGMILVERPDDGSAFTDIDDQVLAELARHVSVALHNVQLDSALRHSFEEVQRKNVELQDSRARIVAAGDAERRKLETNLHDGAQQHLVAISAKIALTRDALESDPDDAGVLLDELSRDVEDAVQQLRSLAHGIYPPLLMAGGLTDALPAAAIRASLPTTVECRHLARYPPELEAAVYFCCLEALQNAGKHAGPGAVASIRVWSEPGQLCFEVADNGIGFDQPASTGNGHGFINMADRLGAMNGGVQVESAPAAGTRVRGQIPIPSTG